MFPVMVMSHFWPPPTLQGRYNEIVMLDEVSLLSVLEWW